MRACIVLASGPSLTLEDIELVRQSGIVTCAVNTTWEKVTFCNYLYAGDNCWWSHHGEKAYAALVTQRLQSEQTHAEFWTCSKPASRLYTAKYRPRMIKPGYNSGANACEVMAFLNYDPVLMLGFDCSLKNGIHHHGPHKKTGNPKPERMDQWKRQFKSLSELYPGRFINCSRYTEIKGKIIQRMELEDALKRFI